ncbi:hypothetical protein H2200_013192 [Cladophialophora chaetospira]|uniref:Uncharacterized protein n=1 Tax=Cladophialophora chaetospira TaxID=386627 RepID=A0AA38WWD3_9EURO|nr:hypothetical protein H2200_013192 [Cladophialophora chaetospira]
MKIPVFTITLDDEGIPFPHLSLRSPGHGPEHLRRPSQPPGGHPKRDFVYLTFDIVPPLKGTFCGQVWNGAIKLDHKHKTSLSTGCKEIYDYIYPATGKTHTDIEWVWICPISYHDTAIPAPPKDPKNSHPTKFTLVGTVCDPYTFSKDAGNAMAMLNVTDNTHKPPFNVGNIQVQVGCTHPGNKQDFSTLSINSLVCM